MKKCEKAALSFLVVSLFGLFIRPVAQQGLTLMLCMIFMCITGYKYWREQNLRAIPYIAIGGLLLLIFLGSIFSKISLPKPSKPVRPTKVYTQLNDTKPKKYHSTIDELNALAKESHGDPYEAGIKHLQK